MTLAHDDQHDQCDLRSNQRFCRRCFFRILGEVPRSTRKMCDYAVICLARSKIKTGEGEERGREGSRVKRKWFQITLEIGRAGCLVVVDCTYSEG